MFFSMDAPARDVFFLVDHPVLLFLFGYTLIPVRHGIHNNARLYRLHACMFVIEGMEKVRRVMDYKECF